MADQPTIGRIVHFYTPNGIAPAIVTGVHEEGDELTGISLHVFDEFGGSYGQQGVAEATEDVTRGRWTWPPQV